MKTITIEIDNTYADLLSITLVGHVGYNVKLTTTALNITDGMKLNINADGKITEKIMENNND